jgi:hypothetical protein
MLFNPEGGLVGLKDRSGSVEQVSEAVVEPQGRPPRQRSHRMICVKSIAQHKGVGENETRSGGTRLGWRGLCADVAEDEWRAEIVGERANRRRLIQPLRAWVWSCSAQFGPHAVPWRRQ